MCRDKWYHSPQMRQAREAHEAANPLVRQHRETAGAVLRKRAPAAQMRKLKKPKKQPRKRKAQAQAQLGSSTAAPSEPPATVTAAASPRVVAPPRAVSWVIPAAPVVSAPPLPAMLRLEERRMRDGTAAATIQRLTNRSVRLCLPSAAEFLGMCIRILSFRGVTALSPLCPLRTVWRVPQ